MELINSNIYRVSNSFFTSNTYIIKSRSSNHCIIIDPGLDQEAIDKVIQDSSLIPKAILATHGHFDHIGSAASFQSKYKAPLYIHEADVKLSQSANFYLKLAKIESKITTPKPDVILNSPSQILHLDEFTFSIKNFPGHSVGSCVIEYENYLFTGDLIYKKGLGFNNFPGEDKSKLKQSISEVFSTYDENHLVLPGHGDFETLINIKNNNIDLKNFLNL